MKYLCMTCPPMPHFIVGGACLTRPGDMHERRVIQNAFDLLYVRSGALHISQNNTEYTLEKGQFLVIFPDVPHKGSRPCAEETQYSWVHFYTRGEYLYANAPLTERHQRRAAPKTYYVKKPFHLCLPQVGTVPEESRPRLEQLFGQLLQVEINKYRNTKRYPVINLTQLEQQATFLQLLGLLYAPFEQAGEERGIAAQLHEHLAGRFADDLSLNSLAELYAYNPSHLIRRFKMAYGISPMQYLLQVRVQNAAKLLVNTDLPVYRIAESVGFKSPPYFIKQFKKVTGLTPAQFRAAPVPLGAPEE